MGVGLPFHFVFCVIQDLNDGVILLLEQVRKFKAYLL